MTILNITPYIPYPLSEGGKISQFAIIDYLRNLDSLTIILVAYTLSDIENIEHLKYLWPNVDIKTINFYKEKPKKSFQKSLKRKLKSLIIFFKNREVVIQNESDFQNNYLINTPFVKSEEFINKFKEIINSKAFDIVQIDLFDFIDLVYLIPAQVKKVFVHHEIKIARLESATTDPNSIFENYIKSFVENSEIGLLKLYDAIFVFSDIDKYKLEQFPELRGKVFNSPFPILNNDFVELDNNNEKIDKIVFVGGDAHLPNKDAIEWYANEIYPLVKNSANLKLHVIGKWNKENIDRILTKCGNSIHFAGFVEDLKKYCKNSIMIVPVRIGSGIRTKILYAMAQGTPVISTSIGCEGIEVIDGESILIANTKEGFNMSILKLYQNTDTAYDIACKAQKVAKSKYSQQAAGKLRNQLLLDLVNTNLN